MFQNILMHQKETLCPQVQCLPAEEDLHIWAELSTLR